MPEPASQVYLRHPEDNGRLLRAIRYLGTTWPHFNRTGGMQRHMVIHGGT